MENLLTILISLLAIIALVQLVRIFELATKLKGQQEIEISDKENHYNGLALLIVGFGFVLFVAYSFKLWGHLILPESASLHGIQIKLLWDTTMYLILFVFFITQPLLFWFSYKYRGKKNNKALYQTHNNKLEIIWTSIPAVVLTALVVFGLKTWNNVMVPDTSNAMVMEVYAMQFNWTARYSGEDNKLGDANYTLIGGINTLGVDINDSASSDDIITREIHLPVNEQVLMKFRSQDVIHSAYMPHLGVQMNCVPGMSTQFAFTPIKTTSEMRKELKNEEFDYVLLCNKICGSAHYNMQIKVIIETKQEYLEWMSQQDNFNTLISR